MILHEIYSNSLICDDFHHGFAKNEALKEVCGRILKEKGNCQEKAWIYSKNCDCM